jgi:hypothetical protein
VTEFLVQPAEKIEHLARLGDGVADVAEVVGELLQLGAVVGDGEIPLNDAAEFGLKKHGALHLIDPEKAFNVGPDGEGGCVGLVDEVEDALGDGVVDPIDETTVDLTPFRVAVDNGRRRTDMGDEAKLAEHRVDEATPLTVVGIKEIELNRDMVADVHRLHDGKRGGLQFVKEETGDAGIRGGGRTWRGRHGTRTKEEVAQAGS